MANIVKGSNDKSCSSGDCAVRAPALSVSDRVFPMFDITSIKPLTQSLTSNHFNSPKFTTPSQNSAPVTTSFDSNHRNARLTAMKLTSALLALLSLLTTALALPQASPPYPGTTPAPWPTLNRTTPYFNLVTSVRNISPTNFGFTNLYLHTYHSGAGLNNAVFLADRTRAARGIITPSSSAPPFSSHPLNPPRPSYFPQQPQEHAAVLSWGRY